MKTRHFDRTVLASALLGIAALLGTAGTAGAAPSLQIVKDAIFAAPDVAYQEVVGDAGGTNHANAPTAGATAGVGLPTVAGGWTNTASFGLDPTHGRGISGYDGSYLYLTEAANVTFQFVGKGNATEESQFQVWNGLSWDVKWDNQSASNGTCGNVGGVAPVCTFAGSQFTEALSAGLIAFRFINLNSGLSATNDGTHNLHDGGPTLSEVGYFLGVDPYQTSTSYDTRGNAVYAGFSDRPAGVDDDYQDLGVRISIPEPSGLALVMAAFGGLLVAQRRVKRA